MAQAGKTLSMTCRAEPEAVPRLRRALSDFAAEAGAAPDQVDAVRLASSEALTNAVLHAYRGRPGNVYVSAALVSRQLLLLVADDGRGLEPRTDRPGLGLGLGLISQVSDDLSIVPRGGGGTEVRMRFDLNDSTHGGRRQHLAAGMDPSPADRVVASKPGLRATGAGHRSVAVRPRDPIWSARRSARARARLGARR
jgi:serine/threonine-protein kinase RsbW/stage II sporulation protein AB (anti-sigma F factor)